MSNKMTKVKDAPDSNIMSHQANPFEIKIKIAAAERIQATFCLDVLDRLCVPYLST